MFRASKIGTITDVLSFGLNIVHTGRDYSPVLGIRKDPLGDRHGRGLWVKRGWAAGKAPHPWRLLLICS